MGYITVINGAKMKLKEKNEAKNLRISGYSMKEISELVGVSKSTVSLWVRDIKLSEEAMTRLKSKVTNGQLKSAENKRKQAKLNLENHYKDSNSALQKIKFTQPILKVICSLLYWCEGGKADNRLVQFTNSDPAIIEVFMKLLRNNYEIDNNKFRACVHLHEYHDANKQIEFWSNITKIPKNQFIKPYLKPNTKKRIRDNYPGCLQIRYYHADLARQIIMSGKSFIDYYRSLV